jgi:YidC/Oxa1 family membrane protein insertase
MDIKRLMTSMLFAAALMMVVFYGPKACSSSPAAQHSFHAPANAARWEGDQSVPPKTVQLGDFSKPATDRLVITINPFTAAIDRVEVNPRYFAATYKRTDPLVLMESVPGLAKPFATTEVRLNSIAYPFMGKAANVDALWHIARKTDTELDLQKDFVGLDNKPLAVITKTFRIDPATYEVIITHTVRNVRVPQVVQRAASDKVIELGAKDVFNVVVKVGETLKEAGRDYTVKGPEGQVSIVDGTIKPTDTVNISFNLPGDKLTAAIDQLGPGELHRDDAQADDRFYHSIHMVSGKNYIDADKGFDLPHPTLSKATTGGTAIVGGPNGQFSDFSKNPQLWIASSNRFFTAVARPLPEIVTHDGAVVIPAGTAPAAAKSVRPPGAAVQLLASGYGEGHFIDMPTHISSANIDLMKTHGPGGNPLKPEEIVSIVRFTGNTLEVPPGTTVSEPLTVYMGPKDRRVFEGDLSAPEGSEPYNFAVYRYIKLIQFQQGCYSYCISLYVIMPILWLLDFLKGTIAFGNYGIAIMILVVIVRALLHPLTRASQVNMAKMGKQMRDVQPKVEAMKKKYADDKKRQSEEMMRIYKENKINPAGGVMGCLPMLIQMPIWAALYSGLRNDIDLRHASFVPGWINDLAGPDLVLPHAIPVIGHPLFHLPLVGDIYGLNLLPLLLTAVFYIQMKVSMASQPKPADEQQAQMQKISQYMIFIFPLSLYNAPSGLNLYIFASTMAGLLDTWLVRKTLKKQGILPTSAPALPTHEEK